MNIYVGNLDYKVSENELEELFSEYGSVGSAKIITDRMSGRSKGFGFVEMEENDEAKKAIEELNGVSVGSRQINVNEARERSSNERSY